MNNDEVAEMFDQFGEFERVLDLIDRSRLDKYGTDFLKYVRLIGGVWPIPQCVFNVMSESLTGEPI